MKDNIIHIQWDGPHDLDKIKKYRNKKDIGLYQIYGSHPVYGSNVLLYIGQTQEQNLPKRIGQKNWADNKDAKEVKVYLGRIYGETKPTGNSWMKQIDWVEKFLIHIHAPAYNSSNIQSLPKDFPESIHIINWDQYRDLLPEVSSNCWTKSYSNDFEVYSKE